MNNYPYLPEPKPKYFKTIYLHLPQYIMDKFITFEFEHIFSSNLVLTEVLQQVTNIRRSNDYIGDGFSVDFLFSDELFAELTTNFICELLAQKEGRCDDDIVYDDYINRPEFQDEFNNIADAAMLFITNMTKLLYKHMFVDNYGEYDYLCVYSFYSVYDLGNNSVMLEISE